MRESKVRYRNIMTLKTLISRFTSFLICTITLFTTTAYVQAATQKRAELVVDVETGKILHSYAAYQKRYPASVTKMMTLYLVFDAIERGQIAPDTKMLMTRKIKKLGKRNGGITFDGVKVGGTISVKDAIYTLITKSANDVAILVSHTIAGSEKNFAKRMTKTARRIGMTKTNFTNASGLPDRKQYTTARDMAVLGMRLMQKFPQYYKYFSTQTASVKGYKLRNHNRMLGSYEGMDGFKTGYINMSGFNLVGSAERNGKRLIGVVFGGKTSKKRNKRMAQILDLGWKRVKNKHVKRKRIGISMPYLAALHTKYSPLDDKDKSEVIMTASLVMPKKIAKPIKKSPAVTEYVPLKMVSTKPSQKKKKTTPEKSVAKQAAVKSVPKAVIAKEPAAEGWNIVAITDTRQGKSTLNIKDQNKKIIADHTALENANIASRTVAEIIEAYHPTPIQHHKMIPIMSKEDFSLTATKAPMDITEDAKAILAASTPKKNEGGWLLQVGAFAKKATADSYIDSLRQKYDVLTSAKSELDTAPKGKDTIFRARFTGLSSEDARKTCVSLKEKGKQCIMLSENL